MKQTLTDNHGGYPYVADLFTLLGKPGVTYTDTDADWLVAASNYFAGSVLYGSRFLGNANYFIGLEESPDSVCYDESTPARCKAQLSSPLCTRYTYAAEKKNYPLTYTDFTTITSPDFTDGDVNAFLALPTSPTTCYPVTEFDLSKYVMRTKVSTRTRMYIGHSHCLQCNLFEIKHNRYPIYLGYAYLGSATYEGKLTLVYTKSATK